MKYSAGMMSIPYLFVETRKTAQLRIECQSFHAIKEKVIQDNLYQMQSAYRAERYLNVIRRRLNSLPKEAVEILASGDLAQAKLMLLISIMATDLLFFEFIHEVFRQELLIGSTTLDDKEINIFFASKAAQSPIVASWKDTTVSHLRRYYVRILFESGLLDGVHAPRVISRAYLPENVQALLTAAGMSPYLACLTGV